MKKINLGKIFSPQTEMDNCVDYNSEWFCYLANELIKPPTLVRNYNLDIRNILVNEPKRLVTVVFQDGSHEIVKCSEEDDFDVTIGVALAIAQHLYISKNKFHKDIKRKTKVIEKEK